ncbi:prepilin-type N-terminal cleavage/methylation domain-containing protein [uncultured Clostridium sp.]|uniref:type II secretion system protein n=1 Tax=uncultured Clostridium sp. TaxID=59620 RepID=UPI0028EB9B77|nr:prepilin-type N-terminal cleavage/methylation domain-containing protein [uncultured Clostridium sp.]
MNQLLIKKNNGLLRRKKKGFTLIELIIVIAIIAIIAAIAMPKFGKIKSDANLAADQANGKIIATAVASAASEGLTPDSGSISSNSNYITYIDGKNVPIPKSVTNSSFYITYSETDGTKVFIGDATGKQVYPAN